MSLNTPKFGPLSGVRVLLSGAEIAGPWAAQNLSDWGAEIIWLEQPNYTDTIRVQSWYSELSRRNMHAMALNIFKEEGRQAFLDILKTCDIFIEASKGGTFSKRGLTDEFLWEINPKLVIAHLSGFGQSGDDAFVNLPAYNSIAQAFSGFLMQNGDVDQPALAFPYTADYIVGQTVTSSVLAAFHNANKTGKGEAIDCAMFEIMARHHMYYSMNYFNAGEPCPRPVKSRDPYWCGVGLYRCSDGYVVMEVVGANQTKNMLKAIEMDHLLGTPELPEGSQMVSRDKYEHGPLVDEKIAEFMLSMTTTEASATLKEWNIAFAKVLDLPDLREHPHYQARETFTTWKNIEGKEIVGTNVFPKFKRNPGEIWRGRPNHGMDTMNVLKEIGYSEEQIELLLSKGLAKAGE